MSSGTNITITVRQTEIVTLDFLSIAILSLYTLDTKLQLSVFRESGAAEEGNRPGRPVQLHHTLRGRGGHRALQLRGGEHPGGDS